MDNIVLEFRKGFQKNNIRGTEWMRDVNTRANRIKLCRLEAFEVCECREM